MTAEKFHGMIDDLSQVLYSFAYNLTKSADASKDLFQETAYRAITNRDKFRDGTNFKAWMFTIMKNIFINNKAESSIMTYELTAMIEELDDSTRIPFMMHYEGYKYQEIADELELPLGTVKSRIFFARKELKGKIAARYSTLYDNRVNSKAS